MVVVAEDGVVEGGVGALVASALSGRCGRGAPTACAGVPVAYLPHGKPADILASLGLDGPGIAGRVLAARGASGGPVSPSLSRAAPDATQVADAPFSVRGLIQRNVTFGSPNGPEEEPEVSVVQASAAARELAGAERT